MALARDLTFPMAAAPDGAEGPSNISFGMNEDSFRSFYTRTARPVKAYLSRVSGDATLADDLLQETYFRFLRAERPEMDEAGEKNYLYRIATNLLNDHFRSAKAHVPMPEIASGENNGDRIHLRADMAKVFGMLKPRERQLLWLAYVEGSSHREIAEVAGLKAGSIKLLLFRARKKLAQILREKGLDYGGFQVKP